MRGVLLAVLLAAMVLTAFFPSVRAAGEGERVMGLALASGVADELGSRLDKLLASGQVLAKALEANPGMGEAQTAALAEGILAGNPLFVGLSTAPGAVIQRYYPPEEGVSWKGHDLLSNPERRDALLQAAAAKTAIFAGPYEAVDGSLALFLRYPVFAGSKLWGFASLTIDFSKLLSSLRLEARYPGVDFALADVSQAAAPLLVAGKAGLLSSASASAALSRPGLVWKTYVRPASAGAAAAPYLYALLAAGLLASVLLFLALGRRPPLRREGGEQGLPKRVGRAGGRPAPAEAAPSAEIEPETPPIEPQKAEKERSSAESPVAPVESLFPDLALVERKRGRAIAFKGPVVKGDLFMPERLFAGFGETEGQLPVRPEELPTQVVDVQASKAPESSPAAPLKSAIPPVVEAVVATRGPRSPAPAVETVEPILSRGKPSSLGQALLFSLEEDRPMKRKAILVVDDSEANRDIVARMLSLRGYKADFARSGEEAMTQAGKKAYEVVFMDCYMPGMDGYEATKALRARAGQGTRAFVVGMSAKVGQSELDKCKAAGMDALLAKPFTLTQILAFLEGP